MLENPCLPTWILLWTFVSYSGLWNVLNTPFTQGLQLFCLHCGTTKLARSPLKPQRRPNGCLGRSRVVYRTFRHRHGGHGRREVLSMFKTVTQRSPRRLVAHRSLKGGRRKAHTSPWWQNGCTVVGHWSPRKKYVLLWTLCINLSNASAFLVPPLCLLWPTNSVHWAITVATTVPPFGDHGNPSATLPMVLPPLCLLCATCCATTAALVVQGRHKGRAAAVTQKQNFLGLGNRWVSWPFFWSLKGGTKVAALCKGGLTEQLLNMALVNPTTPGNFCFSHGKLPSWSSCLFYSICWFDDSFFTTDICILICSLFFQNGNLYTDLIIRGVDVHEKMYMLHPEKCYCQTSSISTPIPNS